MENKFLGYLLEICLGVENFTGNRACSFEDGIFLHGES